MKITLITLNFNGAEPTIKLLESLASQTDKDFSIIVADNGSNDVQKLRDYTTKKDIKLVENGANLGFSGGNNVALHQAFQEGSDWAVLINNDTWVASDFISLLRAGLTDKSGLAGMPIAEEGGGVAYSGRLKWLKTPTRVDFHVYKPKAWVKNRYIIGAGMAISKEAFEKLGPLDEKYFLYFEDIDYSYSAKKAGLQMSYLTSPIINHQQSTTSKKELGGPLIHRYHYRNALYFNFKNGRIVTKILTIPWSALIIIRQVIKILMGKNVKKSKAIIAGVIDFYQDKMGYIEANKIKVGVECENLENGQSRWGVGNMTLNLLKEYAEDKDWQKKYELHLYFKQGIPNDEVFKKLIFKTHILGTSYFNIFYHILLPVRAMWDRLDWMFFPAYMLPPLYIGKSIVMLTGDVYHEYRHGNLPLRYRIAYGLFTNWAAENATKILAISESSKHEVSECYGIDTKDIFVSHLGVKPTTKVVANSHGQYMLFVGQMFPRRHAYESLLAFEKIAPEFPELKFILVGKDKYDPTVIARTVRKINDSLKAERVIHYEYIEDETKIASLYAHAELFVYVSTNEAFGLPPIESAGYGVPVVVKDSAINRELLKDSAFFVHNPKNTTELAEAFRQGLTNGEKRNIIKEQYKNIIPQLTWRKFAERFFNEINA